MDFFYQACSLLEVGLLTLLVIYGLIAVLAPKYLKRRKSIF